MDQYEEIPSYNNSKLVLFVAEVFYTSYYTSGYLLLYMMAFTFFVGLCYSTLPWDSMLKDVIPTKTSSSTSSLSLFSLKRGNIYEFEFASKIVLL